MLYNVRLDRVEARISADPGDHIAKQIKHGEFYEADLLAALAPHLDGRLAIDCGGHVGNHSAFFAAFGPVLAVEPDQAVLRHWIATMRASGRAGTVCPMLAGEEVGARFDLKRSDINTGATQVVKARGGAIPSTTIDALADGRAVAVLKIDVEGHEVKVLRGATAVLERGTVLAVEAHNSRRKAAIEAIVGPFGYREAGRYCKSPTYVYRRP